MIAAISSCFAFIIWCSIFPFFDLSQFLICTSGFRMGADEDIQTGSFVFQLQLEQLNCGAAHLQHPLALRRPLRALPLVEYPALTSVSVDCVHNHTVVFLGTSNGRLRKVRQMTHMHTWRMNVSEQKLSQVETHV